MPSPSDLRRTTCRPRAIVRARFSANPRMHGTAFWLLFAVAFSALCTSCGAVGSSDPAPAVSVTVSPSSAQPFTGANVQFSATVTNAANTAVNWQVGGVAGGNSTVGTIDASGNYTAPNTVPSPANVTVTAVSQSDSSASGSASVTVRSLGQLQGLALSPQLASVTTSQPLQLQIVTVGVTSSDVTWAVDGLAGGSSSIGTISGSGSGALYTPPATAGTHTITATLITNTSAVGSAQVAVTDLPGVLTWRNDNARSGINSRELALSAATVSAATFGKLFSCAVDGYVYAQPLWVPNVAIPNQGTHNVVIVATENDSVYAFDADSNASPCVPLWQASLVLPGSQPIPTPNTDISSTAIVPSVGITGTPTIDSSSSTLYVVAATDSPLSLNSITYNQTLYALDLTTGLTKVNPNGAAIFTGTGQSPPFEPTLENQRAALLLDNGTVYVAYGSYDGDGEYHGWLFAYDAASLQQTGVFDVSPGGIQGGIWQSGGGPSADQSDNVFVVTGDGPFNTNGPLNNYSDSFLRFSSNALSDPADYFTPCDQIDFRFAQNGPGVSAPVLLPDSAGSSSEPHLLIGASKSGVVYVVNRDTMGLQSACPDSPARVQTVSTGNGPILSTPLFWNGAVYVAPGNGNLISLPMAGGILSPPSGAQSPETLGPQGSTPVISWNESNNAILWLIDTTGALASPNTAAILRAYDPTNLSNEIYNSAMNASDAAGLGVKFTVPTVANGKVYVGAQKELDVYGLCVNSPRAATAACAAN